MHYCLLLLTKELPNDQDIKRVMEPYDWNNLKFDEEGEHIIGKYPIFTYDYYVIGGRYSASIKLKIDLEDKKYEWQYYSREPRNGRLFISRLLKELKGSKENSFMFSEEKYFANMGANDGLLYVEGAWAKDILNYDELESYICIDPEGGVIARSSWDGNKLIDDPDYETKFKKIMQDNKDCFVTVLDIHD